RPRPSESSPARQIVRKSDPRASPGGTTEGGCSLRLTPERERRNHESKNLDGAAEPDPGWILAADGVQQEGRNCGTTGGGSQRVRGSGSSGDPDRPRNGCFGEWHCEV